jgi:transposase-like protein
MEALDTAALESLLGPELTPEQARAIYAQGPEAVVFALLCLTKRLAQQRQTASRPDPSAPSGQTPPYVKAPRHKRGKRRGAKPGHTGHRRAAPARIDRREEHALRQCPACQGPVTRTRSSRTRLVEDIPHDIQPVVTEHTIPRYWCPGCAKHVEPVVPDALPGSQVGLRVVVLSAWLHYLLGTTLSQILEVFNFHLHFQLSAGGLVHMWQRLSDILFAWYIQIQEQALQSAVLHADETGWRVNGMTHWLWCFTNPDSTYYLIDRCRGSPALKKFFTREFSGVLVSDFWAAYNAVVCADKQKCLPHLLRDLKRTQHYHRPGGDWPAFAKKLKRLIRDALRLARRRHGLPAERFDRLRQRLQGRLDGLLAQPWEQKHARRLVKRLRRHRGELLTFLERAGVPADNNHAERMIRPAVIVRKNSYANASEAGAQTQAVLMSVFRTLKQRGHNPVAVVHESLRTYLKTGQLTPLPANVTATG